MKGRIIVIKNREEILFIYDVTDANPNGDPLDENKPRIDEETGINIVTDVRLKRTIRDYLLNYKGYNGKGDKDIFVKEVASEKGKGLKDGKSRAKDFNDNPEEVLKKAIDIRLFGGVIPLEKDSITFTGPVQFNMGRSLNKVNTKHIKGTGAFAAQDGKAKTFREEYILPYSLIAFHGIINENAAKETMLKGEDIDLMEEAIWNGTKNLITRSKMGHMPRLYIRVRYKEDLNYFIGDLQKKINIESEMEDFKIRSTKDYKLDLTTLLKELFDNKDKIEKILYIYDRTLKLQYEGEDFCFKEETGLSFEEITY